MEWSCLGHGVSNFVNAGHAIRMPQLAGNRDLDTLQGVLQHPALATAECAPQLRVLAGEEGFPQCSA